MKALVHLSHCSSTKPDGWSGAPGEAAWVRDLVARMIVSAKRYGIDILTVDGDLEDHPAFHDPSYGLFMAPHYESDTHGDHARGWFWGRATNSQTGPEDDHYGALFERRFRILAAATAGPTEHAEWTTINVQDYYGFRLDRPVPGILVEHGIGNGADRDWLRANVQAIADLHAATMAEMMGVVQTQGVDMDPATKAYIDQKFAELTQKLDSGFNISIPTFLRRLYWHIDPLVGSAPVKLP